VLLSKSDKLSRNERIHTLRAVRARLTEHGAGATAQLFSALSGEGVDEAQTVVADWLGITAKAADKKNPGNKGRDSGALK
jgi:GTP-binding protein